jgi:hypothetical protein
MKEPVASNVFVRDIPTTGQTIVVKLDLITDQ